MNLANTLDSRFLLLMLRLLLVQNRKIHNCGTTFLSVDIPGTQVRSVLFAR